MLIAEKELSCVYVLNQSTYWVSSLASTECLLQMLVYILIYYFDYVEKSYRTVVWKLVKIVN